MTCHQCFEFVQSKLTCECELCGFWPLCHSCLYEEHFGNWFCQERQSENIQYKERKGHDKSMLVKTDRTLPLYGQSR